MTALAQNQEYSGTVVDVQGEPIIGASVIIKGSTQGAITDLDGVFRLSGPGGSTLVISYVGYTTQEVKGGKGMKITLREDSKLLSDVVVIGYGVQKKSPERTGIWCPSYTGFWSTGQWQQDPYSWNGYDQQCRSALYCQWYAYRRRYRLS